MTFDLNEFDTLQIGETKNTICPVCGGGTHKDKCFSITRISGGYVFNCFRMKCGIKGFKPYFPPHLYSQPNDTTEKTKEFEPEFCKEDLYNFPVNWLNNPLYKGIDVYYQGWKLAKNIIPKSYFPILDFYGLRFGEFVKTHGVSSKYAKIYKHKNKPLVHFPNGVSTLVSNTLNRYRCIFVVEDIISSCKIYSKGLASCALLGTSFSLDKAEELAKHGFENIIIVLDQDTWDNETPNKIRERIAPLFRTVTFMKIDKDIKDMNNKEFETWIENGKEIINVILNK